MMYGIWTSKALLPAAILVSFSPQAPLCFASLSHFLNGREGWGVGGEGDSLLLVQRTHLKILTPIRSKWLSVGWVLFFYGVFIRKRTKTMKSNDSDITEARSPWTACWCFRSNMHCIWCRGWKISAVNTTRGPVHNQRKKTIFSTEKENGQYQHEVNYIQWFVKPGSG